MTRSRFARFAAAAGLVSVAALGMAPSASAFIPPPTVTPALWPAGVSQSVTVTMDPGSPVGADSTIGIYRALAQGWSLLNPGRSTVSFNDATHTLTCGNGVTFTSEGFTGTLDAADGCSAQDASEQVDIFVSLSPATHLSYVPGSPIVMTIPAGVLSAPGQVGSSYEWLAYAGSYNGYFFITTVEGPPAAGSPSDLIQQVPMPASGSCAGIPDASLAWDTGVSGGWISSWAEWAHGSVCTRTLRYSHSLQSWVVA